ncbi:MAG: hypothetical protein NC489_27970 [Ruminococcus flavefaciens]|nr:hypothetical protein [Ruminococcus flavefaciens]
MTIVAPNVKYYESLGYKLPMRKSKYNENYVVDLFKKITVKVEDLPRRSNAKVKVACDNCGKETIMNYSAYRMSIENGGKHYCNKCFYIKSQETQLKKYGDKSYRRTNECKEKIKKNKFREIWGRICISSKIS